MFKMTILLLAVCLFSGCAIANNSKDADRAAFWGHRIEADGTEYFRIGGSEIMTRSANKR